MMSDDNAMACGICARVLERLTTTDGKTMYQHSAYSTSKGEADHIPVPVEITDIMTKFVCDFCSEELNDNAWTIPCERYMVPVQALGSPTIWNEGDWAACEACATLVGSKEWASLKERMSIAMNATDKNGKFLVGVYVDAFVKHMTGAPRKGYCDAN